MAGAKLLAPTLTPENHVELLDLARHKSKRAIEKILADMKPVQEAPKHEAALSAPESRVPTPAPSPLGGGRFRVQFTGDQALCDRLREAQALLRHQLPDGDIAEIFERALTLLVQDAKRKRFAQTSGCLCPRRGSVWVRRSERASLRFARLPRVPPPGSLGQDEAALDRTDRVAL